MTTIYDVQSESELLNTAKKGLRRSILGGITAALVFVPGHYGIYGEWIPGHYLETAAQVIVGPGWVPSHYDNHGALVPGHYV
jgi:hypothetical protein